MVAPDHQQCSIRFEDPERMLPVDHLARVLFELVGRLDLMGFTKKAKSVKGHAGRPVLSPQMNLTLWLYAVSQGIGSAREIERLTKTDQAFGWLTRGVGVSHHSLSAFRVGHGAVLEKLMVDVLASLTHKGLLEMSMVAQDGTRVRASASAPSFRKEQSLADCREQAELHLKAILADAENPEVSAGQQAAREAGARDRLVRVESALELVKELQAGRGPKEAPARVSTTDVDARVMKMADGGFRPGYNLQFATAGSEFGGPRTIVGVNVTNVGSDMGSVAPMIQQVARNTGLFPMTWLADANHVKHSCIDWAQHVGIAVLMAVPVRELRSKKDVSLAVEEWKQRMQTDEGKRLYKARAGLAELPNAHAKSRFGLDHVLVRGIEKVGCVALLAAITFNLTQHAIGLLA